MSHRRKRSRETKPGRRRSSLSNRGIRLILVLCVAAILLLIIVVREVDWRPTQVVPSQPEAGAVRVIDGDTFEREDGQRVRLLGIDTPEKGEPFYSEARSRLSQLITGRRLTYRSGPEPTDRYGRQLAFVYVDTLPVNEVLVREGFARAYIFDNRLLLTEAGQGICTAQRQALTNRIGIWSVGTPRPETRYFGNFESLRFHRPGCASIRNVDTLDLVRLPTREEFLNSCYSPCRNCDP